MRMGCSPVVAPFPWQPTRTGLGRLGSSTVTSAAAGASAGAAAGSVVPVVGSAIGAIVGAIGGAINASLHRVDPEQANFDQAVAMWQVNPNNVYNIANKYLPLAGLFDLSLKNPHIPIYQKYGRMGEQKFVNDLVNVIYQAAQNGQITGNDTALTVMSRIVQPWIDSWGYGPMVDPHADLINRLIVGMINDYIAGIQTNWTARGGDYPFGNLPKFSLRQPTAASAAVPPGATAAISPVGSSAALTPASSSSSPQPPPVPSTQLTASGTTISAPGAALTAGGNTTVYFGPQAPGDPSNQYGYPIWVNGRLTGYSVQLAMGDGGAIYAVNSQGGWAQWNGTQWQALTGPPTISGATATATAPAATITPIASSAATSTASAASLPALPQVAVSSPTVATTATGTPVTQADLQALVAQLASQGQSAQQAYTSALQTLQNNGVQPSAQVQSAVQSAVQTTPAPTTTTAAGVSAPGWLGMAAVAATLIFATARPQKGNLGRRRRRKST
jgi:hypothetical protein